MKKLITVLFLLVALVSEAQVSISTLPTYTGDPYAGWVPVVISGVTRKTASQNLGNLDSISVATGSTYDTLKVFKNAVLKYYKLVRAGSATDTTSLSARIDLKVSISVFLDSLSAHTTRFNGVTTSLASKLNASDTTSKTWAFTDITGVPAFITNIPTDSSVSINNRINTKQGTLTLTTTGSSGASTLVGSTLNIPQYSGGGGIADDSINTFGKFVNEYTAILRPVYSAGTNTWEAINGDGSHESMGITSVTADGVKVTVNYAPGTRVMYAGAVTDETMSGLALTNSGTPYYGNGPYFIGPRVFVNYAEFYISKLTHASFTVRWDGSAWVVTDGPQTPFNGSSPAWTISWSAGRLRIQNLPIGIKKVPSANMIAYGGGTTNMKYVPSVNWISRTFVDFYFWDASTGTQMTDGTPPTNFAVAIDLGVCPMPVNPLTEDFGPSSNFWSKFTMKK